MRRDAVATVQASAYRQQDVNASPAACAPGGARRRALPWLWGLKSREGGLGAKPSQMVLLSPSRMTQYMGHTLQCVMKMYPLVLLVGVGIQNKCSNQH